MGGRREGRSISERVIGGSEACELASDGRCHLLSSIVASAHRGVCAVDEAAAAMRTRILA